MTVKYNIGEIYETPKGKIRILERIPGYKKNGIHHHSRVVIRMIDTGTVLNIQTTNIASGHFTDYRAPTVYGVGYIGSELVIPQRGTIIRRAYDLWANMLKRAYGDYKTSYKDCSVDVRWHNFTNFLNSLPKLENYQQWENGEDYVLDKDTKVPGNRIYSLDTCKFISSKENIADALDRRWHGTNASV